jgi:D-3-phosphoglycerate dehydrogenase
LLSRSDFITLHVPRLEETKNLIRKETMEKMKPGVRIINCARGEVVNLDDLYEALMGGHVAGAALDVYPQEPPDFALPIFQHPHVIFTPHLGASTGEAQEKVAAMIARQMVSYFMDGVITNAVNFPSISMEVMDQLRPHISLAERMGTFLGQMVREPHDVHITYGGRVTELDTRVLTRAALKGLLGSFTDVPVNYVNAPALAKDKGIGVEETVSQQKEDYMIRIKMPSYQNDLNEIWGTIFAKKYQRLIRLGHIDMDAIPEGTLIVVQSADQPGVVGHIGTTLAKHGTNIARFQAGRREGRSVCVINIDSPVDDKAMEELRALPHVTSARRVQID